MSFMFKREWPEEEDKRELREETLDCRDCDTPVVTLTFSGWYSMFAVKESAELGDEVVCPGCGRRYLFGCNSADDWFWYELESVQE